VVRLIWRRHIGVYPDDLRTARVDLIAAAGEELFEFTGVVTLDDPLQAGIKR
jgi:hypothetical protein